MKVSQCPGLRTSSGQGAGGCGGKGTVHHLCAITAVTGPKEPESICIDCAILTGFDVPLRADGV